jgi:glycosyltransferase involved in cell wall biosynthesis
MPVTDISVALCTYNGGRFLREQLESLASQSVLPAELQVGDDGSTDNTLEIVEEFARTAPFPVGIARNERQLGYGENFIQTARRCFLRVDCVL